MDIFVSNDLLSFIPIKGWNEQSKISFSLKFVELFHVYLLKEFNKDLPDNTDEQFEELISSNPSEEQVVEFYNKLLPNMGERIMTAAIEFKRIFLLNLYSDKKSTLERQIAQMRAQNLDTSDHETALGNWDKINELAKQEKWGDIAELVSQLK